MERPSSGTPFGARVLVPALASLLAISLAAGVTFAQTQAPIRIGSSISLTGEYAAPGVNAQRGYQLCVKQVNEKGGVLGRRFEFVVYDDQSQPATAVRLYEKLITQDKVELVLGPYSSAITEAVANVTEKYKLPMVAANATTTSIFKKGRRYIFMVGSPAEGYLEGLIDMAARNGLKSVGLIYEDTLFPKATVDGTQAIAIRHRMRIAFREAYPKGSTDFSAILTKVRAANPEIFGAATYFDDAVAITRQMKELNVNPKMYGVTVGGDLPKFYELLGKNAEFIYGATQWEPELPYPGGREFTEAYRKEFSGASPSYHSAGAYAGCMILAGAIKQVGSLDRDKIREAILKLHTMTVYGDFRLDGDGFQIGHKMVMFQWQDGKKAIVWPDALAATKARFPTPIWNQR